MSEHTRPGRLIVFEGPDGVGKSTLSQRIVKELTEIDLPCEYLTFPGKEAGTLGRLVYDLHHKPTVLGVKEITATSLQTLHIAAHLDAIEERILPALNEGRWVVLDRFWWSTWVYGRASALNQAILDAMIQVEHLQWQGTEPDVVFLIDRSDGCVNDDSRARLHKDYQLLLEREQRNYPVRMIQNDRSIHESVSQLMEALREIVPMLQNVVFRVETTTAREPVEREHLVSARRELSVFTRLSPAQPTAVFDSYWRFAAERQEVFFRKLKGCPPPWTTDSILVRHKFTNAYRASDRVSQYLMRHVIYDGDQSPEEVFFRTILFKLFNKIETWETLQTKLGQISYKDYSFIRYNRVLTKLISAGIRIYSAAYIMPWGGGVFGRRRKHGNHLRLLELMLRDGVPRSIARASSMKQAFEILKSYPTIGDFLAYQYVTDLNYSHFLDFSEMEFVAPGPGAIDGIRKCFEDLGGLNETDIIRLVTERQEHEFDRLGIKFCSLWGRRLQLIDCQNLFCEVSKYARLKHPEVKGANKRTRIKQIYRPVDKSLEYWYPPKWGINPLIRQSERRP